MIESRIDGFRTLQSPAMSRRLQDLLGVKMEVTCCRPVQTKPLGYMQNGEEETTYPGMNFPDLRSMVMISTALIPLATYDSCREPMRNYCVCSRRQNP